jgi:hypothetical protein
MYGLIEKDDVTEPKFRVGDRVRFTNAVNEFWWFKPGQTGVVAGTDHDIFQYTVIEDKSNDKAYVNDEHIELVTPQQPPKAGDVVRCLDNCDGAFTKGKLYVVRENPDKFGFVGVVADDSGSTTNGWPARFFELAADCAERNGQQQPKFKVGDRVRVLVDDYDDDYEAGDVFTITNVDASGVEFVSDTTGVRWICFEEIELIAEPEAGNKVTLAQFTAAIRDAIAPQPCIVARVVDGTPRPSNVPYVHSSIQSATTEAERLARNNPGQEFAVYQRVAGRVAEVHYEMKEVA